MSLERYCERCGELQAAWTVLEARIDVGRVQRKPMLCAHCTTIVEGVLLTVLHPLASPPEPET